MNLIRPIAFFALAMLAGNAAAIPITKNPVPSENDLLAITALEQRLFDKLESEGVEKLFRYFGFEAAQTITAETRAADALCGKATEVQHVREDALGSHFVRRWYVTVHENCMLHWRLAYRREGGKWIAARFDFNSEPFQD